MRVNETLMDFNVPREVDVMRIGVWLATNSSSVPKRNIWRRMSAGRHSSRALVTGHCSSSMQIRVLSDAWARGTYGCISVQSGSLIA